MYVHTSNSCTHIQHNNWIIRDVWQTPKWKKYSKYSFIRYANTFFRNFVQIKRKNKTKIKAKKVFHFYFKCKYFKSGKFKKLSWRTNLKCVKL